MTWLGSHTSKWQAELCSHVKVRLEKHLLSKPHVCGQNSLSCGCRTEGLTFLLAVSGRPLWAPRGCLQFLVTWSSLIGLLAASELSKEQEMQARMLQSYITYHVMGWRLTFHCFSQYDFFCQVHGLTFLLKQTLPKQQNFSNK